MESPDIFSLGHKAYLDQLDYIPSLVDVFEISQYTTKPPVPKLSSLKQSALEDWVDSPAPAKDQDGNSLISELRLILGPASRRRFIAKSHALASRPGSAPNSSPPAAAAAAAAAAATATSSSSLAASSDRAAFAYPSRFEDVPLGKSVPFSRAMLELIIDEFRLPSSTPWLFVTESTHVHKYTLDSNGSTKPRIGITMRRSTRGVIAMNTKLALSHDPETGRTCGILLGCSDAQTAFIVEQLESCASFAWHPLLLPCLFTEHHHGLLSCEAAKLWEQLLRVETVSGQTGAPAINLSAYDDPEFVDTENGILGVVQLATSWESHTNALLLGVDVIKNGLVGIKQAAPAARSGAVEKVTEMLLEYLELTTHKSKVVLWDLQYITARAQAQTNAVYNFLAKQDNLISQRVAVQSLDLSESSRQIAVAAKRDSSAMKAIAILTMVFLPGTYISTFFAAPLLDFSTPSRLPLPRPTFWLYWAVTAPSTVFIMFAYLSYAAIMKRRHKQEDEKAQEAVCAADGNAAKHTALGNYATGSNHGKCILPIARGTAIP